MNGSMLEKDLHSIGIVNVNHIFHNLSVPRLYEAAIRRHEGFLSNEGSLIIKTSPYTGRLPKDKFIVEEASSFNKISWGEINKPFNIDNFNILKNRVCAYLQGKELFIQDSYVGADDKYKLPVRVVSEKAIGALFAKTMFLETNDDFTNKEKFTILHVPNFHSDPSIDKTHSDAFVIINFSERLILVGGTSYSGEIKKSAFTVMNYLMPQKGVMAMHASANYGKSEDDSAIFFGLSGTGKTTLSSTSDRTLIGDDEHGWSDSGIFNFEGGCYAKAIKLSPETEPEIYSASTRFGTILENVVVDSKTRQINFDDSTITENTRASYPLEFIDNMDTDGLAGHPKNIIMLTCDAFGVLPPVAKLTKEQAIYYFICGYTAKVAGTEIGLKEPQATFSPCFGAPFMPLAPMIYANLLGEKISKHKVNTWLVNTGWSGGAYGEGERMSLKITRKIISSILDGTLSKGKFEEDPIFKLQIPVSCSDIPSEILNPKNTWKDKSAYDEKARELLKAFEKSYKKYS